MNRENRLPGICITTLDLLQINFSYTVSTYLTTLCNKMGSSCGKANAKQQKNVAFQHAASDSMRITAAGVGLVAIWVIYFKFLRQ